MVEDWRESVVVVGGGKLMGVVLLVSAGCGGPHDQPEGTVQVSAALSSNDGRPEGATTDQSRDRWRSARSI